MALTDDGSNMVMPVAPMYGNGGGFGGFGNGGDWAWILLLLLIGGNGWGFGGGFGGFGGMAWGMEGLYPWLNNSEHISDGFRDQMLNTRVDSIGENISNGFSNIATQLCNGFAGVNAGVANAAAQAEISANSRQMANMQQLFGVQSALQNCCCENRANIADLKYTVATENCADRAAISEGIRDVIASQTAGVQRILDQLCADKIDAKNETIANLRQELLFARGQASQDVQTARILAGQTSEVDALYDRLNNCPVGTVPVYGRQPIFSCNNGCGCSGNAGFVG